MTAKGVILGFLKGEIDDFYPPYEVELLELEDHNYRWRGWKIKAPLWLVSLLAFSVTAYKFWAHAEWKWPWVWVFILFTVTGLGLERYFKRSA